MLSGIRDGFHIVDSVNITNYVEVENYRSATDESSRAHVERQIFTEIENGRYKIVNEKPHIVSALGAIPKKNSPDVRLIHDASRPSGFALNDFAKNNSFKYQSIQDAVDFVTPGCYFAKLDLSNAFRCVKSHRSNFKATGLKWRFQGDKHYTYLIDERLPFGARKSPEIFNSITQAVREMMKRKGYDTIICYLDDFLIVAQTHSECIQALNELLCLLRRLGFQINYKKLEGPTQKITFLGIVLNSITMTLSIPGEKLEDVASTMKSFMSCRKVTKRDIQSLVGKLNWITQCVYGGRFHMRRLIDKSNTLKKPWHRTHVTLEMKKDILWWLSFMQTFNGTMPMIDCRPATPCSIDSCKLAGGAFYQGDFVHTMWKPEIQSLPINYLEVLALEPAVTRWAPLWTNKKVFIHSDNQAACSIINRGSCRNPVVMDSLRRVFWLSAVFNFRLKAVYYRGASNFLADCVSRLHEPGKLQNLLQNMNNIGYI